MKDRSADKIQRVREIFQNLQRQLIKNQTKTNVRYLLINLNTYPVF